METDRLPNFVIVGAMRSGTTSLARYLGAHEDVFMAPQKEVHFFDRNFDRGVDWYRAQFRGAGDKHAVGEATQTYLYDERAMQRMAEVLPDARMIVLLRHPIARAYSHYWHNRSIGRESLDFGAAVSAEPDRLRSEDVGDRYTYSYVDRGRYVRQLRRLAELYPRESIHVILFDDLLDSPVEIFRETCRFLEVAASMVPPELGTRINPFMTFRSLYVRRLAKRLPKRLGNVVGRLNNRHDSYPPMAADVRATLLESFRDEIEELGSWLGRDMTRWLHAGDVDARAT